MALVTEGISVRLYHFPDPVNLEEPMQDTSNMRVLNRHWIPGQDPEATEIRGAALDAVSFATHDGGNSHIDALCHYPVKDEGYMERPQRIYGGRPMMYTGQGCRWEFMVSWTMMQIPNGTATPFMGLATF